MPIKLIATDMDGTFLNDQSDYDHQRFQKLLVKMQLAGIRFVVASGNQYPHLPQYFSDLTGDITYLAEDGAHIVSNGETISEDVISQDVLQAFLQWTRSQPSFKNAWILLSGRQAAWTEIPASAKRFKQSSYFYGNLTSVMDLTEVNDAVYKVDITWPSFDVTAQEKLVNQAFQGQLRATSSGLGGIDVILPQVNKAYGLSKLQTRWQVSRDNTLAFGDSGNDLEMLQMAKYGYVMKNAPESVRQQVKLVTPLTNNEGGVLAVIEEFLKKR
ncbi:Cof-type HAD-IIB family hydrolase [Secundilactobacillus folii]|uniref:Cof-type HAD-IIB family hydrolase n=1 Tax=Secundilactobacillus folii TaxID=2678357 RepID=A0A7X2XUX8_9LACO|nr:Cof-type HAD-IIB family hydrolase [Secundilactobacillus folii]MTV82076.1 Cof-type HAD-IIB family hydrolase [Secundilactobacillus folii]